MSKLENKVQEIAQSAKVEKGKAQKMNASEKLASAENFESVHAPATFEECAKHFADTVEIELEKRFSTAVETLANEISAISKNAELSGSEKVKEITSATKFYNDFRNDAPKRAFTTAAKTIDSYASSFRAEFAKASDLTKGFTLKIANCEETTNLDGVKDSIEKGRNFTTDGVEFALIETSSKLAAFRSYVSYYKFVNESDKKKSARAEAAAKKSANIVYQSVVNLAPEAREGVLIALSAAYGDDAVNEARELLAKFEDKNKKRAEIAKLLKK